MTTINQLPRAVVREAIFQAQGGLCFWCNRKMRLPKKSDFKLAANVATLEHLIPGDNSPGNIVVACHACNNKRGDSMIDPVSRKPFSVVNNRVVTIAPPPTPEPKKIPEMPLMFWRLVHKSPTKKSLALLSVRTRTL